MDRNDRRFVWSIRAGTYINLVKSVYLIDRFDPISTLVRSFGAIPFIFLVLSGHSSSLVVSYYAVHYSGLFAPFFLSGRFGPLHSFFWSFQAKLLVWSFRPILSILIVVSSHPIHKSGRFIPGRFAPIRHHIQYCPVLPSGCFNICIFRHLRSDMSHQTNILGSVSTDRILYKLIRSQDLKEEFEQCQTRLIE